MENNKPKNPETEEIILVKSYTQKIGKSGSYYYSFFTDKGYLSCFEKDVYDKIIENTHLPIQVVVSKNGDFLNIKKFLSVVENVRVAGVEVKNPNAEKKIFTTDTSKITNYDAFLVSYAKDIFVEIVGSGLFSDKTPNELMAISCDLVCMARDRFLK